MWTFRPGSTPISAVTNVFYIIAGIGCFFAAHPAAVIVGLAFVILGLGSGWYHLMYEAKGQLWDERGMYLLFSTLAGAAMMNVVPPQFATFAFIVFLVAGVLSAIYASHELIDSMWMIPLWAIVTLFGLGLNIGWGATALVFAGLLVAEIVREIPEDNFGPKRGPKIKRLYDVLHGAWHLMTAYWLTVITWSLFAGRLVLTFTLKI